ncbi:MAG: hypothetical protein FD189_837 [Elusimicrobia bacterium]|nr:MAG: hypothetical protein FD154_830 [Elusimicrobiota bacterium]KAF0156864.1 MAG: hypothetical protein FD189_837 [Elusimicrobiota bacterium]
MLAALMTTAAAGPAKADPRTFVWTYEYMTMHAGKAELGYYATAEVADTSVPENSTWKHRVELEYGLTDRTDLSLYQMFSQASTATTNTFRYDGMKLRARHRLAEKGELPLDTLLYAEYKRGTDLSAQGSLEAKLILAKDLGRLRLAYNQVAEFPLERPSDAEHRFSAGAGWKFTDTVRAGLEATGVYGADKYNLGPTVNFRAPDMKGWVSLGQLYGLNPGSKDSQTRLLLGVPF